MQVLHSLRTVIAQQVTIYLRNFVSIQLVTVMSL